jgi:hypothetical protein
MYVQEFGSAKYMFEILNENQWKKFQLQKSNNKKILAAQIEKKNTFLDISTKPKIGIL